METVHIGHFEDELDMMMIDVCRVKVMNYIAFLDEEIPKVEPDNPDKARDLALVRRAFTEKLGLLKNFTHETRPSLNSGEIEALLKISEDEGLT